jgi:t-SNARE complex subunit (syntaxin)
MPIVIYCRSTVKFTVDLQRRTADRDPDRDRVSRTAAREEYPMFISFGVIVVIVIIVLVVLFLRRH